ncbi:MAG: hypothetical protein DMG65_02610 [Candidatus Angelobacter sp. Gp1-AA117]|nr:MAG: hypothetical protein DMG65_02610 [Candidatus Angelobacter sp. Gp1-AA117]
MRVTAERLKARTEQLRKQGIKVRPVLGTITDTTQKLPESTAKTNTGNDAEKKAVQERTRLAS